MHGQPENGIRHGVEIMHGTSRYIHIEITASDGFWKPGIWQKYWRKRRRKTKGNDDDGCDFYPQIEEDFDSDVTVPLKTGLLMVFAVRVGLLTPAVLASQTSLRAFLCWM